MIPYEQSNAKYLSDQIVLWILFFLFLLIHLFLLSNNRFSPTLVNFLKEELHILGFTMLRKYKTELSFYLFNSFSIIFFILMNIGISYSLDYVIISLNIRLLLIYIILSITIPILRGILHDKFIIKLKSPYFVRFDLQCKLIKQREVESHMIGIYMTTNKLGPKSNESGFKIHKEISEKRWLPKKRRFTFTTYNLGSNLHFHQYSTLINFKEHFLNIVSAIREGDTSIKNHKKIM
ncbi:hypothetical protein LCGC14_2173310 [marine sediment metagenome]|uniref:Uncharacterized protein n=1 Tax=marine sediment metagenome TaxID=412755 RepID=A0A0F9GK84_9ZZZZ